MQTRKWINAALRYDKNCARASLLDAQLNIDDGNYVIAIASLKKIFSQNSCFVSEMISPLCLCYKQLNMIDELKTELLMYLKKNYDLLALSYFSELMMSDEDYEAWLDSVIGVISQFPKMHATTQLIKTW